MNINVSAHEVHTHTLKFKTHVDLREDPIFYTVKRGYGHNETIRNCKIVSVNVAARTIDLLKPSTWGGDSWLFTEVSSSEWTTIKKDGTDGVVQTERYGLPYRLVTLDVEERIQQIIAECREAFIAEWNAR